MATFLMPTREFSISEWLASHIQDIRRKNLIILLYFSVSNVTNIYIASHHPTVTCILGELAGEGLVAVAVGVSDM